jgi:hypothetical protein
LSESLIAAIAERGQEYTPTGRPKRFQKMRDKRCFWNALRVASARPPLRYTEGFALTRFGWQHHAWVVDDQGQAIDVTWAEPGERYIGVAFAHATEAIAAMEKHRGLGGPAFKHRSGDEHTWQPPGEKSRDNIACPGQLYHARCLPPCLLPLPAARA